MTPKGIAKVKPEDREESVILYINIDEETRRKRLEGRRDADTVSRRLEADFQDFYDFTDYDLETTNPNFEVDEILDKINQSYILKTIQK
jgi:guanylate kinase